jgi:tetratricopeptide (TPR) repeat protein
MTSIGCDRHRLRQRGGENPPRHILPIGVAVLMSLLPGCAWVKAQAQQRSQECQQLCSQADREKESGRMARADQLLDQALRKSPRDLEVQRQLADSLWDVGRRREALDQLTRLANDHPHDLRLTLRLATWLSEIGHYEEALARLQPALVLEPSSMPALQLKAEIEAAQGDDDAALLTYQRLCQQESSQADAMVRMGKIYLQRGQPDRAAPLFRSVLTHPRASTAQQFDAQWQLGTAYAASERWSDAAANLAAAAPLREMSADDWHALAYAQYRHGNAAESKSAVGHALALEPRHAPATALAATLSQADLVPAAFEQSR